MGSRSLRDEQYAGGDERRDDRGGERPVHVEAAFGDRLVEEIADGGAERSRENERGPEERRGRDACADRPLAQRPVGQFARRDPTVSSRDHLSRRERDCKRGSMWTPVEPYVRFAFVSLLKKSGGGRCRAKDRGATCKPVLSAGGE